MQLKTYIWLYRIEPNKCIPAVANNGGFFLVRESNPEEPDAIDESSLVDTRLAATGAATTAGGPTTDTGGCMLRPRLSWGMVFDLGLGEGLLTEYYHQDCFHVEHSE